MTERDTIPCGPPEATEALWICSSCGAPLEFDELVLEVRHPDPPCQEWRLRRAVGMSRGAVQ